MRKSFLVALIFSLIIFLVLAGALSAQGKMDTFLAVCIYSIIALNIFGIYYLLQPNIKKLRRSKVADEKVTYHSVISHFSASQESVSKIVQNEIEQARYQLEDVTDKSHRIFLQGLIVCHERGVLGNMLDDFRQLSLPREDKSKLSAFLEEQRSAMQLNSKLRSIVYGDELTDEYVHLLNVVKKLSRDSKCWIVSAVTTAADQTADKFIERTRTSVSLECFNYVEVVEGQPACCFDLTNEKMYIYPDRLVFAFSHTDFKVKPLKSDEILFKRCNFVEEENGEQTVCEYGHLTFSDSGITMLCSNVEACEEFYDAYQQLCSRQNNQDNTTFTTSIEFFDKALDASTGIVSFYQALTEDEAVLQLASQEDLDDVSEPAEKLRSLFLYDLIYCFNHLGHDATQLNCKEGLPMSMVEAMLLIPIDIKYSMLQKPQYQSMINQVAMVNTLIKALSPTSDGIGLCVCNMLSRCNRKDAEKKYGELLYQFFLIVAEADDTITEQESQWLRDICLHF